MNINKMKALEYEVLRAFYRNFLQNQDLAIKTINTAYSDTFYLWRKEGKELFWNTVAATNFESVARVNLTKALTENSAGNVSSLASGYLSHLRKFRLFLSSDGMAEPILFKREKSVTLLTSLTKKTVIDIPAPSLEQVEHYLVRWAGLEVYKVQEEALNKLFVQLCPENTDTLDILLKAATLNVFYSTNIFSIYPVAKHISNLDIDSRLKEGDVTLVRAIQYVTIADKEKNFYSFASKYCSHHNPLNYPIYDSYVDRVLRYFRDRDGFSKFSDADLKDYVKFKSILIDFSAFYKLDKYDLKQIDQYVWQLGKIFFPRNYKKKKKGDE